MPIGVDWLVPARHDTAIDIPNSPRYPLGVIAEQEVYGVCHVFRRANTADRMKAKGELPDRFTVRDVYRKGWSLLGDNEMARNACEELVSLGWLRELVTPPAQGQKRQTEYLTSPKVRG